jgi:hypothetical protein
MADIRYQIWHMTWQRWAIVLKNRLALYYCAIEHRTSHLANYAPPKAALWVSRFDSSITAAVSAAGCW